MKTAETEYYLATSENTEDGYTEIKVQTHDGCEWSFTLPADAVPTLKKVLK